MIGDVLNALTNVGSSPRSSGDGFSARCPAHDDTRPSLSISEGHDGATLIYCHAGCSLDQILEALSLEKSVLQGDAKQERSDPDRWTPYGEAIDTYDYTNEDGDLLFQVVRCAGKKFLQRRPDATTKSGWVWKLDDVRRVLYRLPQVLDAVANGEPIYLAEGERDVHTLIGAGVTATCNPGGAGKWRKEYTTILREADVVIVVDKDAVGQKHARDVANTIRETVHSVVRVEAFVGKDATDHFVAGYGINDFVPIDDEQEQLPDLAPDLDEFLRGSLEYSWLVPGLLEHGDRLMITGGEGSGKSELLRSIAICVSAGIHPFTFKVIEPKRVLFLDAENSERHSRRKLGPLRDLAMKSGRPVAEGMMRILMRPSGLDLTEANEAAWLRERVIAHKPDLLILGPLYRLHAKNPNDELAARATVRAIDEARTAVDCAVIIEAHAGHGDPTQSERNMRPTGSSLWLRWPEFGYGLVRDKNDLTGESMWFRGWRGPRDEREWPYRLERGGVGDWPWKGIMHPGFRSASLHPQNIGTSYQEAF